MAGVERRERLTVSLDPGVRAALRVHARRRGDASLASVVREALQEWLDRAAAAAGTTPPGPIKGGRSRT